MRETLFNWLQPSLPGARCLDLFAGTGALGFEAVSRGAGSVVLVERSARVAHRLDEIIARLQAADTIRVIRGDALQYLREAEEPFDVVFLDPPFHGDLLAQACSILGERELVRPDGLIYLETHRRAAFPPLPDTWNLERQRETGQVHFALARNHGDGGRRQAPSSPDAPGFEYAGT